MSSVVVPAALEALDVREILQSSACALGLSLSTFIGKYLAVDVKEKKNGEEISSGGGSLDGSLHAWVLVDGRVVFDF